MIGTNLGATFLSLRSAVIILTKAIVVDISFFPVDFMNASKISFGGALICFAKEDRSGIKPPSFTLLSFKYFISSELSLGL